MKKLKRLLPARLKNYRKRQEKLSLLRNRNPADKRLPENIEAARRALIVKMIADKTAMIDEVEKVAA